MLNQRKRVRLAYLRKQYGLGKLTQQQFHNKLVAVYDKN